MKMKGLEERIDKENSKLSLEDISTKYLPNGSDDNVIKTLYKSGVPEFIGSEIREFYSPEKIDLLESAVKDLAGGDIAFLDDNYVVIPVGSNNELLWYAKGGPLNSDRFKDNGGAYVKGEKVIIINANFIEKRVCAFNEMWEGIGSSEINEGQKEKMLHDSIFSMLIHEYTHGKIDNMAKENSRILYDSIIGNPRYGKLKEGFLKKVPEGYKKYDDDDLVSELVARTIEYSFIRDDDLMSINEIQGMEELFEEVHGFIFPKRVSKDKQ